MRLSFEKPSERLSAVNEHERYHRDDDEQKDCDHCFRLDLGPGKEAAYRRLIRT